MSDLDWLQEQLGVTIDAELLSLALTHRSYAYEHGGIPTNERLEFLGDSILGFAVTDFLFRENPDLSEGELAKLRSAVVSTRALANVARGLGVGDHIHLGQGEKMTNGRDKASILADTMEAIFGATYVDRGIEVARDLVMRLVGPLLTDAEALMASTDWKTSIQEYAALRQLSPVDYDVVGEGPDHARRFTATLTIAGEVYGVGRGHSKKEAEQEAAAAGWRVAAKRTAVLGTENGHGPRPAGAAAGAAGNPAATNGQRSAARDAAPHPAATADLASADAEPAS
ncbi:ribonuclease 3 [Tersicoccus solisilvae]|uniref:Ribonuclease 3 n=1 Tax=Tersicoccus solisilvae TaxID=1882339 RepID=A0ABQ1PDA6_9MICC|nr:ribonuclease III [Tersicoccus solisilvae]GGC94957.1 ribonuclease 3 [Tersicoccus solisilvae]